jgi:hypothetical protein
MKPELLLLMLIGLAAHAAEEPKPAAEATVQFISLTGDRDDLALWDGRKATPVRLSADFFGPKLRYAGELRLRLIQMNRGAPTSLPTDAPAVSPTPPAAPGPTVAWLDLVPGPNPHPLILLVDPSVGRNGIYAIKDAPGDFPAGSLRLLNACEYPISLEDGRKATTIEARGHAVIRPKTAPGSYFDATIFSMEDGTRRAAYHLHFFYSPERRTLLFILPLEKGSGLVRLQPVEEPPPAGVNGSPMDGKVKPPRPAK